MERGDEELIVAIFSAIRRNLFHIGLAALWGALISIGFTILFQYSHAAGVAAQAAPAWPSGSSLLRSPAVPTLVVFAHPHCPCSRATLDELERLLPGLSGKVRTHVVFLRPKGKTPGWEKEGLWKEALALPGVEASSDPEGREAERFGAQTSGQVFLYAADGTLVFQGGITPARGHMGDSDGRSAILAFAETGALPKAASVTKVYGCSLKNPERALAEAGDELDRK